MQSGRIFLGHFVLYSWCDFVAINFKYNVYVSTIQSL